MAMMGDVGWVGGSVRRGVRNESPSSSLSSLWTLVMAVDHRRRLSSPIPVLSRPSVLSRLPAFAHYNLQQQQPRLVLELELEALHRLKQDERLSLPPSTQSCTINNPIPTLITRSFTYTSTKRF
ncbi:hypothetical protein CC2G_002731 [Coprinopsis cinerea AmutBmut pab1-1]|nr:hypothetical protein CC2G_002731 [Coprinopsis cinerea AmutBmut pab1-1]